MKAIDIVLPVYNEEAGIREFHRALMEVVSQQRDRYAFRLIYVLDRCTDRTFDILRDLARECPIMDVVQLSSRFGHQMSLIAGLDRSSGDAAIMMDADLQHPPSIVPALLAKFEEGYDVVQTVRRYSRQTGWWRRRASSLFYALQNALSPVEIKDGMADFRLLSRRVVRVFQTSIREQNQFLRGLFRWVGFRRAEVEFTSGERARGVTKYQFLRLLTFSTTGIVSFSKLPLRVATLAGFATTAAGMMYAAWLMIDYVKLGGFPRGYPSLILVVLILGGLQLVFLGVIGEYIGAIFDEVKHRPLYVVEEVVEGTPRGPVASDPGRTG
jgi:dolichol-phosphate mannosyltransferase